MHKLNESSCNIASRVICIEKICKTGIKEKTEFFYLQFIINKFLLFVRKFSVVSEFSKTVRKSLFRKYHQKAIVSLKQI